jgi:hypothetical protein
MLENPHEYRHILIDTGEKLEIIIPARRNNAEVVFLFFVIILFITLIFLVLSIPDVEFPAETAFMYKITFFAIFGIAGIIILYHLLWRLTGKEIITVTANELNIVRLIANVGKKKRYHSNRILYLRYLVETYYDLHFEREKGIFSFTYHAKIIRFGISIDEAEAEAILNSISAKFPVYKYEGKVLNYANNSTLTHDEAPDDYHHKKYRIAYIGNTMVVSIPEVKNFTIQRFLIDIILSYLNKIMVTSKTISPGTIFNDIPSLILQVILILTALFFLLWQFAGVKIIRISDEAIILERNLFGLKICKEFDGNFIKNMQVFTHRGTVNPGNNDAVSRYINKITSYGIIKFNYGSKSEKIVFLTDFNDVLTLFDTIKTKYPQYTDDNE